jgi:hypothetical protein
MNLPTWTKPSIVGAIVGAIAITVVGFGWGGWLTAGKADVAADTRANAAVVAALLPICIQQADQDPAFVARRANLEGAPSYQRSTMVMEAGWATMPGTTDANQRLARACAEQLLQ